MKNDTVFIVEDDLVSAQYLKETLEMEGYTILGIADNAPEAIEQLHDCDADIVLMDIILRGAMSGSEAAVILKHRHPECKILFLTAYADEEMIEYALDAQAVGYLMKPYREKEILATIRMALNRSERHSADPSTPEQIHLSHHFIYDTHKDRLTQEGRTIILSEKKRLLIRTLLAAKAVSSPTNSSVLKSGANRATTAASAPSSAASKPPSVRISSPMPTAWDT